MTRNSICSLGKIYRIKSIQFFFQNIQKSLNFKYKIDEYKRNKEERSKSFKFYFSLLKMIGQNLELKEEAEYSEDSTKINNNGYDIEFYDLTGCVKNIY